MKPLSQKELDRIESSHVFNSQRCHARADIRLLIAEIERLQYVNERITTLEDLLRRWVFWLNEAVDNGAFLSHATPHNDTVKALNDIRDYA